MIRTEYQRFLQTLSAEDISEGVRRVANIVYEHLNVLVPLGTYQGQRINQFVSIAQTNWETVNPKILPIQEQKVQDSSPIFQLNNLTVGPFRGFAKQEIFDLADRLVLIYGPNGTGKSSFCEALEYGLLGNVTEADSCRFHDEQTYLKNAYTNSFAVPVLIGIDDQGSEFPVVSKRSYV